MKRLNLADMKFGRVEVVMELPAENHVSMWLCLCSCGTVFSAKGHNLKHGRTKSCGCLKRDVASGSARMLHLKAQLNKLKGQDAEQRSD